MLSLTRAPCVNPEWISLNFFLELSSCMKQWDQIIYYVSWKNKRFHIFRPGCTPLLSKSKSFLTWDSWIGNLPSNHYQVRSLFFENRLPLLVGSILSRCRQILNLTFYREEYQKLSNQSSNTKNHHVWNLGQHPGQHYFNFSIKSTGLCICH